MVEQALAHIHKNYAQRLSVDDLCQISGVGRTSFFAAFQQATRKKPLEYIKDLRLDEAKRLLQTRKIYVATVAYQVGYASSAQFSRDYKKKFGSLPSEVVAQIETKTGNSIDCSEGIAGAND